MRASDDSSQPRPSGRDEAASPGTNRLAPNADVLRAPLPCRGDLGEDDATAVAGDDDRRAVAERQLQPAAGQGPHGADAFHVHQSAPMNPDEALGPEMLREAFDRDARLENGAVLLVNADVVARGFHVQDVRHARGDLSESRLDEDDLDR